MLIVADSFTLMESTTLFYDSLFLGDVNESRLTVISNEDFEICSIGKNKCDV